MDHTNTAAVQSGGRRTTGAESPDGATTVGALHPLELRRVKAGFATRQAFADATGMRRQVVDNVINGRAVSRPSTAQRFADALQIPLEVLLLELHSPQSGVTTEQPRVVTPEGGAGQGGRA